MMFYLVVNTPFADYKKGQMIQDQVKVQAILASHQRVFVTKIIAPASAKVEAPKAPAATPAPAQVSAPGQVGIPPSEAAKQV